MHKAATKQWPKEHIVIDIDLEELVRRGVATEAEYPEDDFYELHNLTPSSSPSDSPTTSATFHTLPPKTDPAARCNERDPLSATQLKKRLKKAAKREVARAARKRRRLEDIAANFALPSNEAAKEKYVRTADPLPVPADFSESSVTEGAYKGKRTDEFISKSKYSLQELVGPNSEHNFNLITWDGFTPRPILDSNLRIIGVLAGHPDDPSWMDDTVKEANELMEDARHKSRLSEKSCKHRRGEFTALRCGVSHGGGQAQPSNLSNNKANTSILQDLNASKPFQRMAGFASSAFATWAPELHAYYVTYGQQLYGRYPKLKRPFPQSVYSATTYNMGPSVQCFPHVDLANLPFGWCAVTALGNYDPTKGGHLVLWNLGLVIEFPPGSLIMFPSATIVHSNTSIQGHETRYSFTHYTAGGIFGWVDQRFQTLNKYVAGLSKSELSFWKAKRAKRWEFGLGLLPVYDSSN